MKKIHHLILSLAFISSGLSAQQSPPQTFLDEIAKEVGTWTADNNAYKNSSETFDRYELTWYWGPGKNSLVGFLYGFEGQKRVGPFWEFHKMWDYREQKAFVLQESDNGMIGFGHEFPDNEMQHTLEQTFLSPGGGGFEVKHETIHMDSVTNQSKDFNKKRKDQLDWEKGREYTWIKKTTEDRVHTYIDSSHATDLTMVQEMFLQAGINEVWDAYTTKEGWESWAVEKAAVDLRIGGTIKSHYDADGTIGDEQTITLHIINYIPGQMLTLQAELGNNFPEFLKAEEKNLYNVIIFEPVATNLTKLTSYGLGYKNDPRFISMLKYFVSANESTMKHLIGYLEN